MANDPTSSTPAEPKTALKAIPDIALDEWCAEKSRSMGKRVEALSAFYKLCQKTGLGRATAEQFDAAFQDWLKQPA